MPKHPEQAAEPPEHEERAAKIARTQRERWVEVNKARRARELLRMVAPQVRRAAEQGDTLARYVADRLDEVL
jgi:uncharacterized protein YjiS (DUF1127 family)